MCEQEHGRACRSGAQARGDPCCGIRMHTVAAVFRSPVYGRSDVFSVVRSQVSTLVVRVARTGTSAESFVFAK